MAEYSEDCCWNVERDLCPGPQCPCKCHTDQAKRVTRREWESIKIADFERLELRVADLIDAGMRLSGQVDTFAIQFHQREQHPEPFNECGNGTCRSSLKHLLAWEQAAGGEGHNCIAEQGRKG